MAVSCRAVHGVGGDGGCALILSTVHFSTSFNRASRSRTARFFSTFIQHWALACSRVSGSGGGAGCGGAFATRAAAGARRVVDAGAGEAADSGVAAAGAVAGVSSLVGVPPAQAARLGSKPSRQKRVNAVDTGMGSPRYGRHHTCLDIIRRERR